MNATIAKRFTFDAAHYLDVLPPEHKCHRMHGHTYEVELIFTGPVNERTGFVIDYDEIAKAWQPLHEAVDHRVLNEVAGLSVPTTENLARWVLTRLFLTTIGPLLATVLVRESSTTWCQINRSDLQPYLQPSLLGSHFDGYEWLRTRVPLPHTAVLVFGDLTCTQGEYDALMHSGCRIHIKGMLTVAAAESGAFDLG